jgi:SpoVK/Ycf46/Vps4 family AAA+-type ATPase
MTDSNFYGSGRQHLSDELLKLDALLELQVLRHREISAGQGPDAFAGLYITEEHIDRVSGKRSRIEEEENCLAAAESEALQARIKKLRKDLPGKIENSLKAGIDLPLYDLVSRFQLNSFELDILLICLAPELDVKYEKLYAYLQDDITKKYPSVDLILNILCSSKEERIAARNCFLSQAPLLRYHLTDFSDDADGLSKPLLSRCLKLYDRVVNFLLGIQTVDSSLFSMVHLVNPQKDWSKVILEEELKEQLTRVSKEYLGRQERNWLGFYFCGPYGTGKKSAAEAFCRELGMRLLAANMRDLLNCPQDFETTIRTLFRESLLQAAAIYIENFDLLAGDDTKNACYREIIFKAVEEFSLLTFLAGEKPWDSQGSFKRDLFMRAEFPIPSYPLRKKLWQQVLKSGCAVSSGIDIAGIADKFILTGGQIRDAWQEAKNLAGLRSSSGSADPNQGITMADLYQGCRALCNRKLGEKARKITPYYSWSDIVLPTDKFQQLREIAHWVKYHHRVYYDWGFARKLSLGKGLNVLFFGSSGTGKTMAAEVIAHELKLDLYKIDLSQVVSKYIGETEKNLAGIFREAGTANAILFFDEADALFGKRSEVKDAHDRYANIEIGYLLQKMEEYEGVVILATNMRKNMDEAFVRRMHFMVEFPFPDEELRLRIWQKIFPGELPLDKNIDFDFLKRNFKITGGNIKNIALAAAFYAANDGQTVTMQHLVRASKREFQKIGKLCVKADFGKYYDLVKEV